MPSGGKKNEKVQISINKSRVDILTELLIIIKKEIFNQNFFWYETPLTSIRIL